MNPVLPSVRKWGRPARATHVWYWWDCPACVVPFQVRDWVTYSWDEAWVPTAWHQGCAEAHVAREGATL